MAVSPPVPAGNGKAGEAAAPFAPKPLTLWQAAQQGHLGRIRELISTGANLATDRDGENITALHWAAINNQIGIAQYLLENGAQVDALGGDLMSTALQWAVRQGHDLMIHTLVKAGANVSVRDNQNFNSLHLAAQYGHPTTCIYLLCQGVDVNSLDNDRRTPLMWAMYKGLSDEVVEVFVRFHSDLDHRDSIGCTALHWGALQGYMAGCRILLKAGARADIMDDKNVTVEGCAEQKGHGTIFRKLVAEQETDKTTLTKARRMMILALVPFIAIGLVFWAFSRLSWPLFLLSCGLILYGTTFTADYLRGDTPIPFTPILAGFFQASVFWVTMQYIFVVLPGTAELPLFNAFIVTLLIVTEYTCYKVVRSDPGFLRRGSPEAVKALVVELLEQGRFDSRHFCTACLIRKPLRSKHDRVLDRCVAKFDHYCPWVNNVVGYKNQRQFVVYLTSAVIVQLLYFCLVVYYVLYNTPPDHMPTNGMCILSPSICSYFDLHALTIISGLWCLVNGLWETATLMSQYYSIIYGITTNELINRDRYQYLRGGSDEQHGHAHSSGGHGHNHAKCKVKSPFDFGIIRNCTDFWADTGSDTDSRPSTLPNYYELYDLSKREGDLGKRV